MKRIDDLEQSIRQLPLQVDPAMRERIFRRAAAALPQPRPAHTSTPTITQPGRHLMRSSWVRLAAVAAILIAAAIAYDALQPKNHPAGAAIAAVVDQIERAHGVKYRQTTEIEGHGEPRTTDHIFVEPGYVRGTDAQGVTVLDFVHGEELWLFEQSKQAVHIQRLGSRRYVRLLTDFKWLYPMRHGGRFLRQEKQDGRLLNVFGLYQPLNRITVWADLKTNLPVRVEEVELPGINADPARPIPGLNLSPEDFGVQPAQPAADTQAAPATQSATVGACVTVTVAGRANEKITRTLSDFEWDPQVDPSLFSTLPPAGYSVREERVQSPVSGEQALVDSLRFWAEMSDGNFPADINALAKSRELLLRKYRKGVSPRQEYEEAANQGTAIVVGLAYAQALDVDGNWHYAGTQVKLGQADQPLCWWKEESEGPAASSQVTGTYRVIYGDLSVRDVPASQLPEVPRAAGLPSNPAAQMNLPATEKEKTFYVDNVARPGVYTFARRIVNLLQVLAAAGCGPEDVVGKIVVVFRPEDGWVKPSFFDISYLSQKQLEIPLVQDNDVVVVLPGEDNDWLIAGSMGASQQQPPPAGFYAVGGYHNNRFALGDRHVTLRQAITMTDPMPDAEDKVTIYRRNQDGTVQVLPYSRKALWAGTQADPPVQPEDVVVVRTPWPQKTTRD